MLLRGGGGDGAVDKHQPQKCEDENAGPRICGIDMVAACNPNIRKAETGDAWGKLSG